MKIDNTRKPFLRKLPGVDHIFEMVKNSLADTPKTVLISAIRSVIEELRQAILDDRSDISETQFSDDAILEKVRLKVTQEMTFNLRPLINATGVVVHTNLGRSLLANDAIENILKISSTYSNLEFNLSSGNRGLRYSCVEELICEVSGAESAMVVNNNAAAVLLCLETLAKDKSVVVSRGELVEIGGAFRIPDVMTKSGAILKEVGTTNRTHPHDYESAIDDTTALLMKVHTSNYNIVGFTAAVGLKDLVVIGQNHDCPVMEDLGSGTFIDFSRYGLAKEPTVQESVATGADIVTFSGDKLLGGPQAGIIVGRKEFIEKIRKNPLTRALRIDKTTLAALEATLRLYRDEREALKNIPTLNMLLLPIEEIEHRAEQLKKHLLSIDDSRLKIRLLNLSSRAGGGSLPMMVLPSKCIGMTIDTLSVNDIESYMRGNSPPIIGRIEEDMFIMDLRTIQKDEFIDIQSAVVRMLEQNSS